MSFDPTYPIQLDLLPPRNINNSDFGDILLKARIELAELKGASGQIPNPHLLTAPLLVRESVESSGIENINTTVANVLENQLLPEDEQAKPDKEVLQYREALYWGMESMKDFALSNRTILGIHGNLLKGVGGTYRTIQNHIVNSKTGEILFTPPVQSEIPRLIGNWEKYVNENIDLDPLIRAAIGHQQFESIHPFEDGNGRTGRILMVLQLVQDEVLELPILFMSGYINKNRNEYYRLLRDVNANGNWSEYIRFMLEGFYIQAKNTKDILKLIVTLHKELKKVIKNKQPKMYSADLVEVLFSYPVITPTRLSTEIGVHYTTASKYLGALQELGILSSAKVGRNHFFINSRLVALLNK